MISSKRDMALAGGAVALLVVAGVLVLRTFGGSGSVGDGTLNRIANDMPTEDLIDRRVMMMSMYEEYADSDSERVARFKADLDKLDDELRSRGVDLESIDTDRRPVRDEGN